YKKLTPSLDLSPICSGVLSEVNEARCTKSPNKMMKYKLYLKFQFGLAPFHMGLKIWIRY
ncbi:unnamed protein product, partial [Allacma fusca]